MIIRCFALQQQNNIMMWKNSLCNCFKAKSYEIIKLFYYNGFTKQIISQKYNQMIQKKFKL